MFLEASSPSIALTRSSKVRIYDYGQRWAPDDRHWMLAVLPLSGTPAVIRRDDWVPIRPKEEAQDEDYFPWPNNKSSAFMLKAISQATDIDVEHLKNFNLNPNFVAVSEKMRWASNLERRLE
ncbi:hypothetical protein PAXINDRAFT_96846 [Paxillus involutus ATCC 200175]|nr:hypothetical protein PAXINDRAFT_96846 [Paxillus involutus ATCC 200175]